MVCKIVTANGKEVYGAHGGDAMEMLIVDDNQRNGGWCDGESTAQHKFICKARIIDHVEILPWINSQNFLTIDFFFKFSDTKSFHKKGVIN